MALIGAGQIHSINSFVLDYENRKNPRPDNTSFIEKLLAQSSEFILPNAGITQRASELEKKGVLGMDALHVACAEEARADYFLPALGATSKKYDQRLTVLGQIDPVPWPPINPYLPDAFKPEV